MPEYGTSLICQGEHRLWDSCARAVAGEETTEKTAGLHGSPGSSAFCFRLIYDSGLVAASLGVPHCGYAGTCCFVLGQSAWQSWMKSVPQR